MPFTFEHRLRLDEGQGLLLRSAQLAPTPTAVGMQARSGRQLGRGLRVVALDHGRRVPGEGYVGHRLWRILLPRGLPPQLYMITGEYSYPDGAFWDFAFGASGADE